MKRVVLAFLMSVACLTAESTGTLVAKIAPSDTHAYFILTDGTFWKVSTFVKRWRSPLEWLGGAELIVPENYISSLSDWSYYEEFIICPKEGYLKADESAASNQEELKKCTHLFTMPRNGRVLFATPLHPADFSSQLYNEGHSTGYAEGHRAGYAQGYAVGKVVAEALDR
jgi:hypothetical protein